MRFANCWAPRLLNPAFQQLSNGSPPARAHDPPDAIKTYSYTQRGQLEKEMLSVAGDSFASTLGHDEFGRVKNIVYPQPLGQEPFGVTHQYDAHGFTIGVRDGASGIAYWELKDVDDAGRYREESFGNGTKTARSYFNDKQALKSTSIISPTQTVPSVNAKPASANSMPYAKQPPAYCPKCPTSTRKNDYQTITQHDFSNAHLDAEKPPPKTSRPPICKPALPNMNKSWPH